MQLNDYLNSSSAIAFLLSISVTTAEAQDGISVQNIEGFAVTGANRLLSEPIWDLGTVGTLGFNLVFEYAPSAFDPRPLTSSTPPDAILATGLEPLIGVRPEDVPEGMYNTPLKEVPVISDIFTGTRSQLPALFSSSADTVTRNEPSDPVTLEQWLGASGKAKFVCFSDGTGSVILRFRHLIPNSLYSAWGVYTVDTDGDGIEDFIAGIPLGGVPHAFVSDERGDARYKRRINFCIHDVPNLKFLTMLYHSDADLSGSVTGVIDAGVPVGIIAHPAISFEVNGIRINPDD